MSPYLTYPPPLTLETLESHMVSISGGTYLRGDEDINRARPVHPVRLDAFELCRFPVTQALWEAVIGENPSAFPSTQRPVEKISWEDCQRFLEKLNEEVERPFRLPTEAEWEYAARGGKNRNWRFAGSPNSLETSNYASNSQKNPRPVGLMLPNEWGLYDLSGNLYEWCSDWYDFYPEKCEKPLISPKGLKGGLSKIIRGGGWESNKVFCQLAKRCFSPVNHRDIDFGFRLARSI